MAIAAFDGGQPKIQPGPGVPQIVTGSIEENSQTFKAGHFVYWVASTGDVAYYPGGALPLAGIALADATEVSAAWAEIPIQVIGPNDEVLIQVATSGDVLEAADTACVIGLAYDTNGDVTKPSYIDSSDVTAPAFVFLGAVKDGAGDSTTWGRFRLIGSETNVKAQA